MRPLRRFDFDSETYPIRPGLQAPLVVCVQSQAGQIEARDPGLDRIESALRDPSVLFVGHNIAFDVLASIASRPRLLALWLDAYDADRVTCTYEREKLIRIAEGSLERYQKNGLADLAARYRIAADFREGDKTKGSDAWRARYHELDGIDPQRWPAEARRYALADLVVGPVYEAQETCPPAWLRDQYRQARGALWQALTSAWGMRTDPRAVEAFGAQTEAEHEIVRRYLSTGEGADAWHDAWSFANPDADPMTSAAYKALDRQAEARGLAPLGAYTGGLVRLDGSRNTKAAAERMRRVCAALGLRTTLTDTGRKKLDAGGDEASIRAQYVSLNADACAGTGDPVLIAYARYTSIGTLRARCERLRLASVAGLPIQPRYDNLKETGRTSCSAGDSKPGQALLAYGDQTQNLPRAPGLRECYRARPGCLILSVDWRAAELHTLAQTCLDLGFDSQLARVLNSGRDVHLWFGAVIRGWSYEWAEQALAGEHGPEAKSEAKSARQAAKAANFGFPGGLGIEKFRLFAAKTYRVILTEQEARDLKDRWLEAFPEMIQYFAYISDLVNSGAPLIHPGSERYRGKIRYTSAANSFFQGRCADMAKDTGWRLALEIWRHGLKARLWAFAHDEFLLEVPHACAHEVAEVVVRIMQDAGRDWCPGAPVMAEPALQYSWRKGAEPAYRAGRLIPHEDRDIKPAEIETAKKELARGLSPIQVSWVLGRTEAQIERMAA